MPLRYSDGYVFYLMCSFVKGCESETPGGN